MHWRKWAPHSACALSLWVLFPLLALGQSTTTPEGPHQGTGLNLRVETTLVLIPVAVTDSFRSRASKG
jgi:hypothetical protein